MQSSRGIQRCAAIIEAALRPKELWSFPEAIARECRSVPLGKLPVRTLESAVRP